MKSITTFIFLASAHLCFSQTDTLNRIFDHKNYKLQYPKSWRLDTSGMLGAELFLFSPLENQTDKFSENINLIIQDLTGQNIDLEKYKDITDSQINEFVTEPKVFESSIIKKDKNEYYRINYTMTQGKLRLNITSHCIIRNEKAYLITLTIELDKYEQYKKVGEEILFSFSTTE